MITHDVDARIAALQKRKDDLQHSIDRDLRASMILSVVAMALVCLNFVGRFAGWW